MTGSSLATLFLPHFFPALLNQTDVQPGITFGSQRGSSSPTNGRNQSHQLALCWFFQQLDIFFNFYSNNDNQLVSCDSTSRVDLRIGTFLRDDLRRLLLLARQRNDLFSELKQRKDVKETDGERSKNEKRRQPVDDSDQELEKRDLKGTATNEKSALITLKKQTKKSKVGHQSEDEEDESEEDEAVYSSVRFCCTPLAPKPTPGVLGHVPTTPTASTNEKTPPTSVINTTESELASLYAHVASSGNKALIKKVCLFVSNANNVLN